MPHSFGYRAGTRSTFAKAYRKNGTLGVSTYLKVFRLGDIVDLKGDGAVQKGMPHKYYHGKTGVVWNVTKRAIGVVVNKQVNGRIIRKRIHVRTEHANHSKCKDDFKNRVKANPATKTEAKKTGVKVCLKRQPAGPR